MINKRLQLFLKKKPGLLLSFFFLTMPHAEIMASDDPDVPTPPFVAQAPNPSEWVITYAYDDPGLPSNPTPNLTLKEMRVTKVEKTKREVSVWSDGTQTENWYMGSVSIERQPTWPAGLILARISGASQDDFLLGWVNATYFKRKEDKNGHSCFLYEAKNSAISPGLVVSKEMEDRSNDQTIPEENRKLLKLQIEQMRKVADSKIQVWIDTKTLLPVEVDDEGLRKQFEFTKSVPKLELPPSYQKQFDQLKKMYPNAVGDVP